MMNGSTACSLHEFFRLVFTAPAVQTEGLSTIHQWWHIVRQIWLNLSIMQNTCPCQEKGGLPPTQCNFACLRWDPAIGPRAVASSTSEVPATYCCERLPLACTIHVQGYCCKGARISGLQMARQI